MKIVSAIEALCDGGAQTVLVDLALSMTEHEHRVIHFSSANGIAVDRDMVDDLARAGIRCLDTHWNSLRSAERRDKVLGDFRPDVVICHWWGKDPWMPWLTAERPATSTDARDPCADSKPTFICVLHHANIDAADTYDRYVVVSRSQLGQVAHVPAERVHTIPNGVDLARFSPRRVRTSARPMVVGRLSNLREGKIPPDWVETLASFRVPDTRFVIAGDGALLPALRDRVRELHLERPFSFPGYIARRDVPALLETFDVFCYVTSTAVECNPLVLLEAIAAGVPVVAEARGGIPEIVIDGANGLLANSIGEVGRHLHRLRRDPALRDHLARGARASAERFATRRQVDAYRALLAGIEIERQRSADRHEPAPMQR